MSEIVAGFLMLTVVLAAAAGPGVDRTVGDLKLTLTVEKATYYPGEPVSITMRVTNTATGPLVLKVYSGQQYDVIVRQRGAVIWQWSHDKAFVQVVREMTMAPGESRVFTWTWDQRDLQGRQVEPGVYEISAVFFGAQRGGSRSVEVGAVRITIGR